MGSSRQQQQQHWCIRALAIGIAECLSCQRHTSLWESIRIHSQLLIVVGYIPTLVVPLLETQWLNQKVVPGNWSSKLPRWPFSPIFNHYQPVSSVINHCWPWFTEIIVACCWLSFRLLLTINQRQYQLLSINHQRTKYSLSICIQQNKYFNHQLIFNFTIKKLQNAHQPTLNQPSNHQFHHHLHLHVYSAHGSPSLAERCAAVQDPLFVQLHQLNAAGLTGATLQDQQKWHNHGVTGLVQLP